MAQKLVAIKYKIKLTAAKPMKRPDFNSLVPPETRGNVDWCIYTEMFSGVHLDKKSKMRETDAVNPDPLMQWEARCVPEEFAVAAVSGDPENIEILDEIEFEDFYNARAHDHEPAEKIDQDVLNAIRAKHGIEGDIAAVDKRTLSTAEKNALDPLHPAPGIVKNVNKTYADHKANRGFELEKKADIEAS